MLARLLLAVGRDDELSALLDEYKDEVSADWLYTRARWHFRCEGASRRATRTLQTAFDENGFVPLFMLDVRPLPLNLPEYISPGAESEAIHYVVANGTYWFDTPGAIEWFVAVLSKAMGEVAQQRRAEENARKLRLIMGH